MDTCENREQCKDFGRRFCVNNLEKCIALGITTANSQKEVIREAKELLAGAHVLLVKHGCNIMANRIIEFINKLS